MSEKSNRIPSPFRPYNGHLRSLPEAQLLRPIWRQLPWLVLVAGLAGGGAYSHFDGQLPVYPVRAELIVRFGYEYTPVATTQNNEQQQVNFRLDEVIGSEIQLLTSLPLIDRALSQAPYPAESLASALTAQAAAQRLGVERIEGSTVLLLSVQDHDVDWAMRFMSALIPLYFEERRQLYAQEAFADMLARDRDTLATALQNTQVASDAVADDLAAALAEWDSGLARLAGQPEGRDELVSLEAEFSAMLIRLSGSAETAGIAERLARHATARPAAPDQPLLPGATAPTETPAVDLTPLRAAMSVIVRAVHDMVRLAAEHASLTEQLSETERSLRRQKARSAASEGIAILSPPYVSEQATGLNPVAKGILVGVLVLLLGAMLIVIRKGTRNLR